MPSFAASSVPLAAVIMKIPVVKNNKKRGWDKRGIIRKITLERLGLSDVAEELAKYVELSK